MFTFGPVPSRRLGRSLGINNIPPKICTYACIYCQLGRTIHIQIKRQEFYAYDELIADVRKHVESTIKMGEKIDYMTFVPDGEPTLDINLGREIKGLSDMGIKIAVITNASLIWDSDVREALYNADWVSVKIDALNEHVWHAIDRPHRDLSLSAIKSGIAEFSAKFTGTLVTETMLVRDVNDSDDELANTAKFISIVSPAVAYISIPTRPPAEKRAVPPSMDRINSAYQIYREYGINVEYLTGYEGNEFDTTGDIEKDLLNITSVHPMREDAVQKLLDDSNADWDIVRHLINEKKLIMVEYRGEKFYLRNLHAKRAGL